MVSGILHCIRIQHFLHSFIAIHVLVLIVLTLLIFPIQFFILFKLFHFFPFHFLDIPPICLITKTFSSLQLFTVVFFLFSHFTPFFLLLVCEQFSPSLYRFVIGDSVVSSSWQALCFSVCMAKQIMRVGIVSSLAYLTITMYKQGL